MYGGHGYRKFYSSEITRIEEKHKRSLPPGGYTPQQIEAGYDRLSKAFGFYHTLLFMEEKTPFTRKELLSWSVAEFNYNLTHIAWRSFTDEKYSKTKK